MASESVPLLNNHEPTTVVSRLFQSLKSKLQRAVNWHHWPKISDGLILLLVPIAIGCSVYILTSPTSRSPCRGKLNFFQIVLLLLPIALIMPGALITSTMLRRSTGAEQPAAYRQLQLLFGFLLGAWFSACVFSASSAWLLLLLLVVGAFYACGAAAVDIQ